MANPPLHDRGQSTGLDMIHLSILSLCVLCALCGLIIPVQPDLILPTIRFDITHNQDTAVPCPPPLVIKN